MSDCDGFFQDIPFEDEYEDLAVRHVLSADFYNPEYKKWLILCWYDTTYGSWNGSRFDLNNSRTKMSAFLKNSAYNSFEELLDA